jgi:aspartate kinase
MDLVKGRAVVKFGGADLSSGADIRKAAEMVIGSGYGEIAVVVSAMGRTTDDLIEAMSQVGEVGDRDYADVVSMGERTSARLFYSALRSQGISAIYLEPHMEEWPIITDSNCREAKPDMEETCIRVKRFLEPQLSKTIPVVCGFLGLDKEGDITTLGRGGSDTTAVVLGNCLRAEEIILVKDTGGIMSADPKVVPDAKPLERLSIHEMLALAQGGAKIVKAEALMYKLPEQKLRIVSFSKGLRSPGTEILGCLHSSSFEIRERQNLVTIGLISEINSENLSALFSSLKGKPIYGISTAMGSVTVFTSFEEVKEVLNELHGLGIFRAVSSREKVGMIELTHPVFINQPGWATKVSDALASRNINVIEITMNKSSINIFVDESQLDYAIKAVRDAVET